MDAFAALIVLIAAILCGAFALAAVFYRRIRTLSTEVLERKNALRRTSKLLIDKNLELFDQNLRQQKQLESKEDFIGIVSHQLRTPATEVKWGLEALDREIRSHAGETELAYLKKLRTSVERMIHLIDSLVRLMNIEEGYRRLSIPPYEPDAVIRNAVEAARAKFADKRIGLTLTLAATGPTDAIDADSLDLVADNLIENAFQYTKDGGGIIVTTSLDEKGDFVCSVADTGIGISVEKQKTVFVKFQRSETAMRMNSGGMGLGLYLVKSIIDRHGGTVSFRTEEGKGTAFTFTLPAKRVLVAG